MGFPGFPGKVGARGSDRLREVLERCDRTELVETATVVHGLAGPKEEWEGKTNEELRRLIERELRYQGSSALAFLWRRATRGAEEAGAPYEEIVEEVLEATHLNESFVHRLGAILSDSLYAGEMLLALLMSQATLEEPGDEASAPKPAARLLEEGLKAMNEGGGEAYRRILKAAGSIARSAAGAGLALSARMVLGRSLALVLGPVVTGLTLLEAARAVYSFQGPNLLRCVLAVAAIGSLRLKYFPLTEERRKAAARLIESIGRECRGCRSSLKAPDEVCLVCLSGLHRDCGTAMIHLESGAAGHVCSDCRKKDLEGPGLLVPAASPLRPGEWMEALGYIVRTLNNRLDRTAVQMETSLRAMVDHVHQLRRDIAGDLRSLLKSAFGYLYAMFFTTVFLSLFGIAYFKTAGGGAPGTFNPGVIFRLSLLVMLVIPFAIWLVGALVRAARNARREDFERRPDGRRLGLKDYLLGFLYYDHPVENVWGPITLIGATVLALMWLFLLR